MGGIAKTSKSVWQLLGNSTCGRKPSTNAAFSSAENMGMVWEELPKQANPFGNSLATPLDSLKQTEAFK